VDTSPTPPLSPGRPSLPPEQLWLSPGEEDTWRGVWTLMTRFPARLDAQLRADAGLSLAEYGALSQLSEAPQRTLRLSELADGANLTLSHLSRVMTRLEKLGWATRTPDPSDGRFTLGHLTDAGFQKVVETAPGHVAAVREMLFDALTPEQSDALGEAVSALADQFVDPRSPVGGVRPPARGNSGS